MQVVVAPKMIVLPNVHSLIIIDHRSQYTFIRVIGKGGFGRVWKVCDKKTKQTFAMKVIDKARVISKKSVGSIIN